MTTQPTTPVLAAIHQHLTTHDLPEVVSIHLGTGRRTLQLQASLPVVPSLLSWATTPTEVTAHAYRAPHGDHVHLSIRGETNGVRIEVYGAIDYDDSDPLIDGLPVGTESAIPLDMMRRGTQ